MKFKTKALLASPILALAPLAGLSTVTSTASATNAAQSANSSTQFGHPIFTKTYAEDFVAGGKLLLEKNTQRFEASIYNPQTELTNVNSNLRDEVIFDLSPTKFDPFKLSETKVKSPQTFRAFQSQNAPELFRDKVADGSAKLGIYKVNDRQLRMPIVYVNEDKSYPFADWLDALLQSTASQRFARFARNGEAVGNFFTTVFKDAEIVTQANARPGEAKSEFWIEANYYLAGEIDAQMERELLVEPLSAITRIIASPEHYTYTFHARNLRFNTQVIPSYRMLEAMPEIEAQVLPLLFSISPSTSPFYVNNVSGNRYDNPDVKPHLNFGLNEALLKNYYQYAWRQNQIALAQTGLEEGMGTTKMNSLNMHELQAQMYLGSLYYGSITPENKDEFLKSIYTYDFDKLISTIRSYSQATLERRALERSYRDDFYKIKTTAGTFTLYEWLDQEFKDTTFGTITNFQLVEMLVASSQGLSYKYQEVGKRVINSVVTNFKESPWSLYNNEIFYWNPEDKAGQLKISRIKFNNSIDARVSLSFMPAIEPSLTARGIVFHSNDGTLSSAFSPISE